MAREEEEKKRVVAWPRAGGRFFQIKKEYKPFLIDIFLVAYS